MRHTASEEEPIFLPPEPQAGQAPATANPDRSATAAAEGERPHLPKVRAQPPPSLFTTEEVKTVPPTKEPLHELTRHSISIGGAADALAVSGTKSFSQESNGDGVDPDADTESVDSYGIPRYYPHYPKGSGGGHGDTSVPWNLRQPNRRSNCTFFDALRMPQMWRQLEFATRITALAVLIPAALIAAKLPNSPFISAFMPISASVLAAKRTSGEAVAYIFSWARAGCFWLPLSIIAGALHLGDHMAAWCVYYTIMLFIMATFTEGIVRRISLLLFNSCMVGFLVDKSRDSLYPCRVMVDWCIGTGLCTVAAFFPYPIFCKKEAQRLLGDLARNAGTAYRGLVYSFWSPSNVERNMAMSKVRVMTESLDELLPKFENFQSFSFYEFFFESPETRIIRDIKFTFFERLRVNLSSMTRVLDMVEAKPSAIDDSDRCKAFGELLNPHLNAVAEAFDDLVVLLAQAKTRGAILDLQSHFSSFQGYTEDLEDAYKLARRMLFYEHTSAVLEEFVPLMTFYLFTVVCVRDTVDIFYTKVRAHEATTSQLMRQIFEKTIWGPFMDNINFLKKLLAFRNRREVQVVIEAAKVSGAMILTIGFSYLIEVSMDSFTGPNIIAFIAGSNPVEAVQESIVRLTGCLLGTVLGFFAGTYSKTAVQRVASLCTLMFCGTFLRNDKEYAVMAVYGMFVLIPLDSILETTIEDTVARMNQNTFGIFIYLFVSALVLPLSPSLILRAKRSNVLRQMSETINSMMELFTTPLSRDLLHQGTSAAAVNLVDSSEFCPVTGNAMVKPISNRSMHMLRQTDTFMDHINTQIIDVTRRLKGTKDVMRFAKDERTLVEVDYPVKACEKTQLHMYRMTMLLKTMWMSWNVIRSQRYYTEETKHMMASLQPIARDVAVAFQRFVDLMAYMLKDPAINLEGDIMKSVLDLISASTELHTRKSQIMLILINKSVENFSEKMNKSMSASTSSGNVPHNGIAADAGHAPRLDDVNRDLSYDGLHDFKRRHGGPTSNNSGLRRSATFDGAFYRMQSYVPVTSPCTAGGYNFRVMESERNVSVFPLLNRDGKDRSVASIGPLRLPPTFQFPVSSEDAEGMHSFTLSLEMFANETKLLMMSLSTMLDLLRSKM